MARRGTHLIMGQCGSVDEAHELFGLRTDVGATRLVLVPKRGFLSWTISVPTGMFALLYKQGRFVGVLDDGLHVKSPLHQIKILLNL